MSASCADAGDRLMVTGERRPLVRKQQQQQPGTALSTQAKGPQQQQQQQYYRMNYSGQSGPQGAPAQRAQHIGSSGQTSYPNYAPSNNNPQQNSNYPPGGAAPVNYVSHRAGGVGGGNGSGGEGSGGNGNGLNVQSLSVPFHARRPSTDRYPEATGPGGSGPAAGPGSGPAGGTSTTTFPYVRASLPLVAQNPVAPAGAGRANPYSISAREQLVPGVGDEPDEVDEVRTSSPPLPSITFAPLHFTSLYSSPSLPRFCLHSTRITHALFYSYEALLSRRGAASTE